MECASLAHHFGGLSDPRVERTRAHALFDIIAITICAVICGADDCVEIAEYGRRKEEWLRTWLELANGIPSHDTFTRVLARLDAKEFASCLASWMAAVAQATKGQVIAVDGKSMRGSRDSASGRQAIHMVRAWASHNHLVLGQVKVEEKANEITAIPELLKMLDVAGCIVTIDAIGCQKAIAQEITDKGGQYVLLVKANQGQLQQGLIDVFQTALRYDFDDLPHSYTVTTDKDHGRIEKRECFATADPRCLALVDPQSQWPSLRSLAMVRRYRRETNEDAGQESVQTAYYITSLEADSATVLDASRTHWSIENGLHWTLDVAFREDDCRVRTGNGPENLASVRQLALGLLKQDTTRKVGIKAKRKAAGWDDTYLLHIINQ